MTVRLADASIQSVIYTRVCQTCQESKTESYYSIYISLHAMNFHSRGRLTCNECMVKQTFRRLFFADDLDWQNYGSCNSGVSPSIFFPESKSAHAREEWVPFCASCPVAKKCLAFGEKSRSTGIFGGVFLLEGIEEEIPYPEEERKPGRTIPAHQKIKLQRRLLKLVNQGASKTEMVAKLGVSEPTINRWMRKDLNLVS